MKLGLFHFQLLYNVLENIHFIYDEEELADTVLTKISETLNAEAGTIFRIDIDGTITPLASYGAPLEKLKRTEFRVGKGVVGWVAQYVQPVKVDDPKKDARFMGQADRTTGFQTRSIVAAPILAKGKAIGVIEFLNRRDGSFNVPDLELISMIGREVGIAFENVSLVRKLTNSQAFLESMVNSLSAGLVVCDPDDRVIELNPRAMDIIGASWAPTEPPRPAAEVLAKCPDMLSVLGKASASDKPLTRQELPVKTVNGTLKVGWSGVPIKAKNGRRLGTAVLFQDITKL
ncbi:MAG: GAF domain-containing protein [Elusimicrobiota bacterium]|nr:GAF domain-containing protein [Elusimicrobiota bacterium]